MLLKAAQWCKIVLNSYYHVLDLISIGVLFKRTAWNSKIRLLRRLSQENHYQTFFLGHPVSILSKGLYAWNVFLKDEKCLFIQFSEVKCQINAKCISLSLSRGISHHHTTHCTGHHFISKSAKKNMFLHSYHAYSTHFVYFNFQFWIFYCSIS